MSRPGDGLSFAPIETYLMHADPACLVFNKPPGLAVQDGSGLATCLERLVAQAYGRPGKAPPRLVHRLDRETSGVVLMARTKPAAAFFSAAFSERRAEKTYLAIVCGGAPDPAEGEIATSLLKTKRKGVDLVQPAAHGQAYAQAALTRYATLAHTPAAALVSLAPLTGRMHQLRVHLASIGRPIAGDGKYGGLFAIAGAPARRLMLHAADLSLAHPNGAHLSLHAPVEAEFAAFARRLGLDHPALLA
jgi:tRNA pseudouridine32 synthase/23S rRNA pseudouridine746 synthase